MSTVDARGLSCPEPVIMAREALKSNESSYTIMVDNTASRENVARFCRHQGYNVDIKANDGEYTLEISK